MAKADDSVWFEFVESKVFSKQVGELPAEVPTTIQSDLVQTPIASAKGNVTSRHRANPRKTQLLAGSICNNAEYQPQDRTGLGTRLTRAK